MKKQCGFTLIEIAIVLLIIGLLLGGVMKGQSLINSARARSIANDLTGIEAAWVAFRDRYRALPGDYLRANTHISVDSANGSGNAVIDTAGEVGGVWQHLSKAGYISGNYSGADVSPDNAECVEGVCPANPFGGFYKISNAKNAEGDDASVHGLLTGDNIPVDILYELDLKIDDGKPDSGRFRASNIADYSECIKDTEWNVVSGVANCAGVLQLPL